MIPPARRAALVALLLPLGGCHPEAGSVEAAQEAAEEALDEIGDPTLAIVRVAVDDPERIAMVWGVTTWGAIDLDAWLSPCRVPAGVEVSADLEVAPGHYPWVFLRQDAEGLPDGCVWDRLSRLPLDEPSERGRSDLYRIRWQAPPRAVEPRGAETRTPGRRAIEPTLVPPYYRWASTGSPIDLDTLRFEHGLLRYRGHAAGHAQQVDVGEVVPLLECRGASAALVRTLLVFEGGDLREVETAPTDACIERRAQSAASELGRVDIGGHGEIGGMSQAILLLDVPGGGE